MAPEKLIKTVILSMVRTELVVEFWREDHLVRIKKYDGMTTAFRFDVCNFLESIRRD